MFEKKVLRIIFGPKRDEVTGGWRKLRNEEFHNLYSSPHAAHIGKKMNGYRMLVGKPEGEGPLGRPRHGWVDSIKMDLR
jgi:hypothetical protein